MHKASIGGTSTINVIKIRVSQHVNGVLLLILLLVRAVVDVLHKKEECVPEVPTLGFIFNSCTRETSKPCPSFSVIAKLLVAIILHCRHIFKVSKMAGKTLHLHFLPSIYYCDNIELSITYAFVWKVFGNRNYQQEGVHQKLILTGNTFA